jgi:hypothetical protein
MKNLFYVCFALFSISLKAQKSVFVSVQNDSVCLLEETPTGKPSSTDNASLWLRADKVGELIYNCPSQLKQKNAKSGVYKFDPDGDGANIFEGYYDSTEGGGWLMILNYLHQGGTNPALNVRTTDLPLMGSSTLGTDESGTTFWGHAAPSLLNEFDISEVRFYGITSGHSRVVHFKTSLTNVISYIKTGVGSMSGIATSYGSLSNHTGNLPGVATHFSTNSGNGALTHFPMVKSYTIGGNEYWTIRGNGTRWEMDDRPNGSQNSTLHRVFIRANCDCPAQSGNPADGAAGDYWQDMSSYSNNAIQDTASIQPIYRNNTTDNINFNPNFYFNNDFFRVPWAASLNPDSLTVFSVNQVDGGAGTWRTIFGSRLLGSGGYNLYASIHNNYQFWTASSYSNVYSSSAGVSAVNNSAEILGIDVISGTDGSAPKRMFRNGTTVLSILGNYTPNPNVNYTLGKNDNGSSWPYIGRIAEQIVYPKILSTHEKDVVETYLAIKYGVTLSHDYISPDSVLLFDVSNGYNFGITGVGKNTSQGLYQKKSKSESDINSEFTIELTTEISSGSYLICGHNNVSVTGRRTLAGKVNVLNRDYYAEQTGGVGTINIALDLSKINADISLPANQIKIIISDFANYSNPYLQAPDYVSGGVAYFIGVPLNDKYFTFKARP